MFKNFYPNKEADSVYEIDFESMVQRGVKGILFDIDNTLVPHGAPAEARTVELFEKLRALGLSVCLISNNKESRVKPFADAVKAAYICKADKPLPGNYIKAAKQMGCVPRTAVFIGDQLFTDIYGARKAGMYSILVKPIHPKEEIQIVLKRKLEAVVLYFYHKEKSRR